MIEVLHARIANIARTLLGRILYLTAAADLRFSPT